MVPWFRRALDLAALALLLQAVVPAVAPAQLRLGFTAGTHVFGGASAPVAGGDTTVTLRPHGAYAFGAAASLQRGAWLARLGIEHASPGASAVIAGSEVADRTILDVWSFEPTVGRRVYTTGEGAAAWVELGAGAHYWLPYDGHNRFLVGGTTALVWTQRAARRVDLSVRAHLSVSPSPFTQANLTPELAPAALWRWGVTIEVARRM